ncbi:MAG: hypothetical protein A3K10_15975 [Bacteroidetes bacterium RIFCSPLOWO2_12_FULL_31_6]|nr:MAG: hypothetical protein A3K10_15975 [Bacteroidetes bacterium RIFCSPLOWO2_12_FULL_31_6]
MKPSKYNCFVSYNSKIVGCNALKNSFIILEPELLELYQAAVNENRINDFYEIHPEFFEFMTKKGFFVEDKIDELKKVKILQKRIDGKCDLFHLFINPTMNCNFKCWYCYEEHIKDSKMSKEIIVSVEALTQRIIKENKSIKRVYLSWFGGEPLLQFKPVVLPLLKIISEICEQNNIKFNSGFTTNGLLINQGMIDDFKTYNVDHLQITLDGIQPLHDSIRFISKKKGSYTEIIKNIILLAENNLKVLVRINCTDETLKGLDDIMTSFSALPNKTKKNISFTFHRIWQIESALDEDVSYYINKYNGLDFNVSGNLNDSFRDSCYADKKNQAIINYNGDVFKCTARDFSLKNREGVLNPTGEIVWNNTFDERMNIKLKNKSCQECSILPMCGGGCSQIALDNIGKDYCIYDYDEQKKKKLVLDAFLSRVTN